MKKIRYILLLLVLTFTLTACSTGDTSAKTVKVGNGVPKDYKKAVSYYKKKLEKSQDPELFIALANLHRENYNYGDEGRAISSGMNKIKDNRDLEFRYSEYLDFTKGRGVDYLNFILRRGYDEEVFKAFIKTSKFKSLETVQGYYHKFKDEIDDLETKILAYGLIEEKNVIKREIEEQLIDSEDIDAYEALIERAYSDSKYEKVEELILSLDGIKEETGVSKRYTRLLEMKDLNLMDREMGHFIDKDREDLAVIYKKDNGDLEVYLALVNGDTGEFIFDQKAEALYADFYNLEVYERKGELDQLGMVSTVGMSAYNPVGFGLYDLTEDGFEESRCDFENDIEIELLKDFKVRVESKDLAIIYIIDIPKEDRPSYIEDGQYARDGNPIGSGHGDTYRDNLDIRYRGEYRDTLVEIVGFAGSNQYAADRLGYINKIYIEIDGELKLTHFSIDGIDAIMDTRYELRDGVGTTYLIEREEVLQEPESNVDEKKDDSDKDTNVKDEVDKADQESNKDVKSFDETMKDINYILSLEKEKIREIYGEPEEIGAHGGGDYWVYGEEVIYFYIEDYEKPIPEAVSAVGIRNPRDSFGIKGDITNGNVKTIFKNPIFEGEDEYLDGDYIIKYKMDSLEFYFGNLGKPHPYVMIKRTDL